MASRIWPRIAAAFAAQRAARDAQGLAALGLGLGLDEIAEPLDARKIDLAVEKARQANSPGSATRKPGNSASASMTAAVTARPPVT